MNAAAPPRAIERPWLDRLGALGSGLCALHCAAAPLVFLLIPTLDAGAWFGHGWEIGLVAMVTALASIAAWGAWHKHHGLRPLALLAAGVMVLWAGIVIPVLHEQLRWHVAAMTLGGTLVAFGHIANLRQARRHQAKACCAH